MTKTEQIIAEANKIVQFAPPQAAEGTDGGLYFAGVWCVTASGWAQGFFANKVHALAWAFGKDNATVEYFPSWVLTAEERAIAAYESEHDI